MCFWLFDRKHKKGSETSIKTGITFHCVCIDNFLIYFHFRYRFARFAKRMGRASVVGCGIVESLFIYRVPQSSTVWMNSMKTIDRIVTRILMSTHLTLPPDMNLMNCVAYVLWQWDNSMRSSRLNWFAAQQTFGTINRAWSKWPLTWMTISNALRVIIVMISAEIWERTEFSFQKMVTLPKKSHRFSHRPNKNDAEYIKFGHTNKHSNQKVRLLQQLIARAFGRTITKTNRVKVFA